MMRSSQRPHDAATRVRMRPTRWATALALACTSTTIPVALDAQTLTGVVRDASGRPLGGVDVILVRRDQRTRSDSLGRFGFAGLAPGAETVRARLIGYRPLERPFTIAAAGASVEIVLERYSQLLDTMRVVDQDGCNATSLAGFECRRRAGQGYFRDAGEIRALRPTYFADMLDGMPGLRRQSVDGPHGIDIRPVPPPSRCLVTLWNGQPPMKLADAADATDVPRGRPESRSTSERAFPPDMNWLPRDIVAIELYDEYRRMPRPYRGLAWPIDSPQPCMLVIYWTRGAAKR